MTIKRDLVIGGEDVPALDGRTTEDLNPYTGEVYAVVAAAGAADVTRAVDAAQRAFPSWSQTSPAARRRTSCAPRTSWRPRRRRPSR